MDDRNSAEHSPQTINNFSITFGTVNGSGSQTANTILFRALFQMGIPVSGKNFFPSNIQGQPTWYSIRVSKDGYTAWREESELVVAINPTSFAGDVQRVSPGGVLFYTDDLAASVSRSDITAYPMPVRRLTQAAKSGDGLSDYASSMVYVGVVSQMLGIPLDEIQKAIEKHFNGKQPLIEQNFGVVRTAAEWAANNLEKRDPYRVAAMPHAGELIICDGNKAAALGSIFGGVQFSAWYPITPSTTLPESLNQYLPELRKDPDTGKQTCAVVQAEDEIAAAGMVIGAGWAGLRSMTATSGPGLSLMCEYVNLAYFADIPVVIWDVQRTGPSTGLPTRTAQGDLTGVSFFGHGDTRQVMLFPGSVNECFEFGWQALDLAERLQTPVFVMSDLDLGMNNWVADPFAYPSQPMDRGKILWEADLEKMAGEWGRYLDVDGDGIPYRTVMGNKHPHAPWLGRGTAHNEFARYTEDPATFERVLDRLDQKFQTARELVPLSITDETPGTPVGIIAYGSADPAVKEARDILAARGLRTDYLRVRAAPFPADVRRFIEGHDKVYVVELNRDGQMAQLLSVDYPDLANRLVSAAHVDGRPLSARWIVDEISKMEGVK